MITVVMYLVLFASCLTGAPAAQTEVSAYYHAAVDLVIVVCLLALKEW